MNYLSITHRHPHPHRPCPGLELGIWNRGCHLLQKMSSAGASIKNLKIRGCQRWCSEFRRVPGTRGTRANSSPDVWHVRQFFTPNGQFLDPYPTYPKTRHHLSICTISAVHWIDGTHNSRIRGWTVKRRRRVAAASGGGAHGKLCYPCYIHVHDCTYYLQHQFFFFGPTTNLCTTCLVFWRKSMLL
jgi:hypothetical protein